MYPLCRFRPWSTLVTRFAASLIHMMASRGPSSAQHGPAAILVCHPECAPARSLAQGEAHAASAPHGLGNLRALPFSWSCKTPSSASWEEWTPTADVRGMMHFGDRSQPLSALPGQRANSARPDPRRECPPGTAAWRTPAGHQSPRAGVASRSRNRGTARIRPPPGAAPFKRFCGDTPAIPCLLPTA